MPDLHRRRLVASLSSIAALTTALAITPGRATTPLFSGPVRTAINGTEPGIDIGDDGSVFINVPSGLGARSELSRSTDGGRTFQRLVFPNPYNRLPGGGDSDVALGPDGHVYFLDLWGGSNSIVASDDNGATWTRGTPFTTLPLTDRQWIALGKRMPDGQDTVYVAYQLIQPPSALSFARSRNGGLTWEHHAFPSGTVDSLPGQIVSDGDYVAISYVPQGTGQLWVARSFDAGDTWAVSRADTGGNVSQSIFSAAGVALDRNDLWVSFVDRSTFRIMAVRSRDRGATWDEPVAISDAGVTGMFPWIAARDGKVALAWYGASTAGDPNGVTAENIWQIQYAESVDGSTFGAPVAATGTVKRGPICTRGLSCTANRELGDFLQLAIDGNGKSLITYVATAAPVGTLVVRQI